MDVPVYETGLSWPQRLIFNLNFLHFPSQRFSLAEEQLRPIYCFQNPLQLDSTLLSKVVQSETRVKLNEHLSGKPLKFGIHLLHTAFPPWRKCRVKFTGKHLSGRYFVCWLIYLISSHKHTSVNLYQN